jgi:para-nitrobenzyl esterase
MERVDRLGPLALAGAMARCRCGGEVPRGYRALRPDAGTAELVGQLVTDHLLRVPLHRLADGRRDPSYVYEFAWSSRRPGMGSCHALELGFVFDSGAEPDARKLAGEGAPQDLADAMHGAWVRFVSDGSPGWERWDTHHPVQIYGDGDPHVEHGPRDRELALWATAATEGPTPAAPPELRSVIRRLRHAGALRRN